MQWKQTIAITHFYSVSESEVQSVYPQYLFQTQPLPMMNYRKTKLDELSIATDWIELIQWESRSLWTYCI